MPGTDVAPRAGGALVPLPGLPQRKRESEALPARWLRATRRNRHVTVPVAIPLLTWPAAEIMHANGLGLEIGFAGVTASVAVWLFAPHKWTGKDGEPRMPEVWYARSTAVAFSGWLTAASLLGPVSASGPALAGSLAVLSAAWGIPWWRHHRIRGMKDREKFLRDCRAFWDGHAHAFGAGGSNVIDAEEEPSQVRLRIQLIAGRQSLQTLKGSVHLIESAVPVGAGMVRVEVVDGNASQADVFIKQENPLREPVEWDESRAPSSILDDWYPGKDERGKWRRMAQLESLFAIGATGTGKSTLLLAGLLARCGCRDVVNVLIDLKGGRSGRPVLEAGAADYVITTVAEAEMFLLMCEAEIEARMEGAYDGHEQLTPTESTPAVVTDIDETRKLTSVAKGTAQAANSLATVATTGRSAIFRPKVFTQYGSLDSSVRVNETRMNLRQRFAFRTETPDEAAFAIPEYHRLDASALEEPGTSYAKDGPKTAPEQLRVVNMSHDAFRKLAPARIAKRGPKPPLRLWCGNQPCPAGGTWQQWWDSRWGRLPAAFREFSPQYREWAEEFGEPEEASPSAAPSLAARARASAPPPESGDEDGATVAARIAAETSGPDVAPTAAAQARAGDITARNQERFFALLAAAPLEGARAADLIEQSGTSNGWAYNVLRRLADRGAVTQPRRGLYAPAPGRDAKAEAAAVKAGDDALRKDAEKRQPHLYSVG